MNHLFHLILSTAFLLAGVPTAVAAEETASKDDLESVSYLSQSAALPECKQFWESLLKVDTVAVVSGAIRLLPSPEKCLDVPELVSDEHRRYVEQCKPFLKKGISDVTAEETRVCRHGYLYYRAALRHWSSPDSLPAEISDRTELAEKYFWFDHNTKNGNFRLRNEKLLQLAERIMELSPKNLAALAGALRAATVIAIHLKEKHASPEMVSAAWSRAEPFADRILAASLEPAHKSQREFAWYTKTHGMEKTRVEKFKMQMAKDLPNKESGSVLVSGSWAPLVENFTDLLN